LFEYPCRSDGRRQAKTKLSKYALAVIFIISHILHMAWVVEYEDAFAAEVAELSPKVRVELVAHKQLLARFGPQLGRPWCDT
jgi:hypothetical protein